MFDKRKIAGQHRALNAKRFFQSIRCVIEATTRRALDKHRIAKFVRSVAVRRKCRIDRAQHRVVEERPQQSMVACAGLVCAGEDGVDDTDFRPHNNPSCGNALPGPYNSRRRAGGFESAHDGGADRDDAAAAAAGCADRRRGRHRD